MKTELSPLWINDAPAENDILKNEDGSEYIPIGIVELKLTKLDSHWGTENFWFNLIHTPNGDMLSVGSIDITIEYGGKKRKLVGTATLFVPADVSMGEGNTNFSATTKSECIKNGVKAIGRNFGSELNDRIPTIEKSKPSGSPRVGRVKPPPVEMVADSKAQDGFNKAYEAGNTKIMDQYKLMYPAITYTGKSKDF